MVKFENCPGELNENIIKYDYPQNYMFCNGKPIGKFVSTLDDSRYVGLAHEFIHAVHDFNNLTKDVSSNVVQKDVEFYVEYLHNSGKSGFEKFYDFTRDEEIYTVGANDYNDTTNVLNLTENDIRREHLLSHRLTHNSKSVVLASDTNTEFLDWLNSKL